MHADHIRERHQGGDDSIENLRLLCEDCHKFRHGWFGWMKEKNPPLSGWSVFDIRKKLPNQAAVKYLKLSDTHYHIRVRPHWMLEKLLKCGCRIEVRQYLRPPYSVVRYKYPDILVLCLRHSPKSLNEVMPQERWNKLRPRIFTSNEWKTIRKRLTILLRAS
jgi:HNH endonuclease